MALVRLSAEAEDILSGLGDNAGRGGQHLKAIAERSIRLLEQLSCTFGSRSTRSARLTGFRALRSAAPRFEAPSCCRVVVGGKSLSPPPTSLFSVVLMWSSEFTWPESVHGCLQDSATQAACFHRLTHHYLSDPHLPQAAVEPATGSDHQHMQPCRKQAPATGVASSLWPHAKGCQFHGGCRWR